MLSSSSPSDGSPRDSTKSCTSAPRFSKVKPRLVPPDQALDNAHLQVAAFHPRTLLLRHHNKTRVELRSPARHPVRSSVA